MCFGLKRQRARPDTPLADGSRRGAHRGCHSGLRKVLCLGAVAFLSSFLGTYRDGARRSCQSLLIEQTSLDLGEIPVGLPVFHCIAVTNRAASPVRIAAIESSCTCVSIATDSVKLGSGESARIPLVVTATPRNGAQAYSQRWQFKIHIKPVLVGKGLREGR